jgi:transcriptional regulator with XRE-family HTH domain
MTKAEDLLVKLQKVMRREGLRQADLCAALDLTESAINHRFTGRTEMSVREFFDICEFIGVNPCDFIDSPSGMPMSNREKQLLEKFSQLNPAEQRVIAKLIEKY